MYAFLTQEAEFQAWKRRKNYDPLKSAAAAASGGGGQRKTSSPKNAYSPAPNSGPASPSPTHQHTNSHYQAVGPQHRRIQARKDDIVFVFFEKSPEITRKSSKDEILIKKIIDHILCYYCTRTVHL
jgi:hypothetical protein